MRGPVVWLMTLGFPSWDGAHKVSRFDSALVLFPALSWLRGATALCG